MLGGKKFVKWVKATFFKGKVDRDIPQTKTLVPDRQAITGTVCSYYGVTERDLAAVRRGVENEARDMAIYLLRTVCGESLMVIGASFGMKRYSSVSSAVDRIKKRQAKEDDLLRRLSDIIDLVKKGQTET
ncbi:MAG: hypothetical protein GY697_06575 [Desulfobacterales bacterium]|nr:hypothetical protein [Desulfobacterales bacterium]